MTEMDHLKTVMDVRSRLKQAIDYLVRHRNISPREAHEWVQQEARAKKAGLDEVAQAVLVDRPVPFHYDVPL
jgi:AmiR/NasT family two-component response regulator